MLTLRGIAEITGSPLISGHLNTDIPISGFSIDTRTLKSGDVFIALQGEVHHGNKFINMAFEKGAIAVLTDQMPETDISPVILVKDSLAALAKIAQFQRAAYTGKVVGVTGTVGKTSVKEALRFLIHKIGLTVHASEKSYNNHIGVPLTLANLDLNADIAILEIGTNHPGEILALSKLVQPDVAVVTAVGAGHIEYFPSVKDIAQEKVSIAAALTEGGIAILPAESEFFTSMKSKVIEEYNHRVMSFGTTETADVCTLSAELRGADKLHITANVMGSVVSYELPTANTAWINNSLAILAAAHAVRLDVTNLSQYFSLLPMAGGRGRVYSITYQGKHIKLIDDAYNANPLSMKAALETLAKYPGRKIAVIGDMRELGSFSEEYHIEAGQLCNTLKIDRVLTCGEWMKHAFQQLSSTQKLAHVNEYSQIEAVLKEAVQDGDVIMFKASNGVKLHAVVASILAV
jgi:UDP-N-acetylmuramoyl-tripeptide--D-alanyl-D-alanine ligase